MISITVNQTDLAKVKKMSINLPKNVETSLKRDTNQFAKMIQKGAKLRAPVWTGKLRESIIIKATKNGAVVEVGMPYGMAQEFGFRPHYVQLWRPTGSGFVVADWAAQKGAKTTKGSIFVAKNKPFIRPAVEKVSAQIPSLLSKSIANAIKKS